MKILHKVKYLFAIMIVSILASCEQYEEVDYTFNDTTEALLRDNLGEQASLFYQAVIRADKMSLLNGEAEYTVLVPTSEAVLLALNNAGFNSVEDADTEFLSTFVDNHLIAGNFSSFDLEKSTVTNEAGNPVYVTNNDNGVWFNGVAQVTTANEASTNGMVHIINFALTNFASNTIADIVVESATADTLQEFTTLLAALQAAGLDDDLAAGEFTVFAPTDAAFAAIGLDETNVGTAFTQEELVEILGYHVLTSRNVAADLFDGRYYTLAGSQEDGQQGIDVEAGVDELDFNDLSGTAASSINLLATNGVIHVVDNVILPRPYITSAVKYEGYVSPNLSGLIGSGNEQFLMGPMSAALNNVTTIDVEAFFENEEDTFSILAPIAGIASGDSLLIVKHAFPGLLSLDDAIGTKIQSIGEQEYFVTEDADGVPSVNGRSRVNTVQDIFGLAGDFRTLIEDYNSYNGLLTSVLFELTPLPAINVDSVLTDSTNYSLFNGAVKFFEKGGISGATYLAVHDSTFVDVFDEFEVPGNDVDSIEFAEDLAGLEEALNAHIITEVFFSGDLEVGDTFTDLNGDDVTIVQFAGETGFGIEVRDDGVISTVSFGPTLNVLGNNGVVHVVDNIIPLL